LINKLPGIILFSGLMVYIVLRAIFVPMLHDEIATFFRYVHINEVFPWFSEWSANNHYLNSLMTLIHYRIFGSSPVVLRLANLMFFPLYFYFSWKISGLLKNPWLKYGLLLSLLFAHNFLEFFGTSRGYGISMALLMGAVWYTILLWKEPKPRYTFFVLTSLVLATYANLTIMNSFILLTGFIVMILLLKKKREGLVAHAVYILLLAITPLLFFTKLLFRLQAEGELHYGKPDGFISVSVATISKLLTGHDSMLVKVVPMVLFAVAFVIFVVVAGKNIKNRGFTSLFKHQWIFLFLLTGNIAASVLENKIFGTNFPEDRTGLYFYPLLAGSVFFSLDQIRFRMRWKAIIPAIPFVFFLVHFLLHLNLSWSSLENQAIPERFYKTVSSDISANGFPSTVQGYQGRVMRWAFMNYRTGTEAGLVHFSGYPSLAGDYQIVTGNDYSFWDNYYEMADKDKQSGLALLKRKTMLNRELIYQQNGIKSNNTVTEEFFELSRGSIDTLAGSPIYFGFDLELVSTVKPLHAWIVATVYDTGGNTIRYEFFPVDWYRADWSEPEKPIRNGILIHDLPENTSDYVFYIWNIRKDPFELRNGRFSMFKMNTDY
jgi:hypothetical protein